MTKKIDRKLNKLIIQACGEFADWVYEKAEGYREEEYKKLCTKDIWLKSRKFLIDLKNLKRN